MKTRESMHCKKGKGDGIQYRIEGDGIEYRETSCPLILRGGLQEMGASTKDSSTEMGRLNPVGILVPYTYLCSLYSFALGFNLPV